MQLAFNPYLFLFSHGTGVMWWYDPLMRAIILLPVDETFLHVPVYACHLSWADIWVGFI